MIKVSFQTVFHVYFITFVCLAAFVFYHDHLKTMSIGKIEKLNLTPMTKHARILRLHGVTNII